MVGHSNPAPPIQDRTLAGDVENVVKNQPKFRIFAQIWWKGMAWGIRRGPWGHHFFFINMSVISPGVGTSLRGDVPTLARGGTGIPTI